MQQIQTSKFFKKNHLDPKQLALCCDFFLEGFLANNSPAVLYKRHRNHKDLYNALTTNHELPETSTEFKYYNPDAYGHLWMYNFCWLCGAIQAQRPFHLIEIPLTVFDLFSKGMIYNGFSGLSLELLTVLHSGYYQVEGVKYLQFNGYNCYRYLLITPNPNIEYFTNDQLYRIFSNLKGMHQYRVFDMKAELQLLVANNVPISSELEPDNFSRLSPATQIISINELASLLLFASRDNPKLYDAKANIRYAMLYFTTRPLTSTQTLDSSTCVDAYNAILNHIRYNVAHNNPAKPSSFDDVVMEASVLLNLSSHLDIPNFELNALIRTFVRAINVFTTNHSSYLTSLTGKINNTPIYLLEKFKADISSQLCVGGCRAKLCQLINNVDFIDKELFLRYLLNEFSLNKFAAAALGLDIHLNYQLDYLLPTDTSNLDLARMVKVIQQKNGPALIPKL